MKKNKVSTLPYLLLLSSIYFCTFNKSLFIVVLFVTLATSILLLSIKSKEKIKVHKFAAIFLPFVFFVIFQLLFSFNLLSLSFIIVFIASLFISLIFTYSNADFKKKITSICLIFSNASSLYTIFSLFFPSIHFNILSIFYSSDKLTHIRTLYYAGSYTGWFSETGYNAFYICIGLLIISVILLYKIVNKNDKKKMYIFLLCQMLFGLLLTSKRGLLAFFVIEVLILIIFLLKNKKRFSLRINKKIIIGIPILIIFLFTIFRFYGQDMKVFNRLFKENEESFFTGRLDLYDRAIEMFAEKPLTGWGINTYKIYNYEIYGSSKDTHNVILQLLAETGVMGTIIIIYPLLKILSGTLKKMKISFFNSEKMKYLLISFLIQTLFLLYFTTGNSLYDIDKLLIYFVFSAFYFSILKHESKEV